MKPFVELIEDYVAAIKSNEGMVDTIVRNFVAQHTEFDGQESLSKKIEMVLVKK